MTIEKELVKAVGFNGKRQPRQDFLAAIVEGVDALNDDEWDSLSKDAQAWANDAMKSRSNNEEISEFVE